MLFKNTASKFGDMAFETFLSGAPARDRVTRDAPCGGQTGRTLEMVKNAGCVPPGAGAGISAQNSVKQRISEVAFETEKYEERRCA